MLFKEPFIKNLFLYALKIQLTFLQIKIKFYKTYLKSVVNPYFTNSELSK
jgi:hypothetical protein